MTRTAPKVGHKSNSAGVVFLGRVVKALFRGESEVSHEGFQQLMAGVSQSAPPATALPSPGMGDEHQRTRNP